MRNDTREKLSTDGRLGTVKDEEIAKDYNLTRWAVTKHRQALGIAPYNRKRDLYEEMKTLFQTYERMNIYDIKEMLQAPDTTIFKTLNRLISDGVIRRVTSGLYKRNPSSK